MASPNKTDKNVLVLLSGGIDSSTCIHYYLSLGYIVHALFVEYGQPNAEDEFTAASSIARHYKISFEQKKISNFDFVDGYIPGRNLMLLSIALMSVKFRNGLISIGIHAGTEYVDCSSEFKNVVGQIFDLYNGGAIQIDAPFLFWSKNQILEYSKECNVPLQLTFSSNLINSTQYVGS